ncbi:MAG TPA: Zn-dependent exopeptidase M28, partial [Candidatus Aminicenantes bacterium]|nr:Zn-dependent exopeptidase M28 [Candidatus Aminicenantes bacterium]
MTRDELIEESEDYLTELCVRTSNRAVGSEGNRRATEFLAGRLASLGWPVETERFPALDWQEDGADLRCGSEAFAVFPSPYSLGCELTAPLIAAATVAELAALDVRGKVLLLHGELAREQIMPKGFVFYNPEEHRRIVALLEAGGASALVCATGYNPGTAGGVYPFPLFEDGDFDLPSVFMTEAEGKRLLPRVGQEVGLHSRARRIPSFGDNVVAGKGATAERRIVVSAHIDAKKGTPGAI